MVAEELKLVVKAEVDKAISDLRGFQGQTDKAKDAITGMAKSVGNWIKGIGLAVVSVQSFDKALKFAFDSAKLYAQARQIETSFENIAESAGVSAAALVSSMRKASKGTMDTVSLMKNAARANLFGLPLEKMGELMEIARASAMATGQSVEFMFDSIVTGIGRASPMILDNLGIIVKVGDANDKYAKSLGKTAEQLTVAEQKQAMLNAVLESGGEILKKVGSREITDAERWQALTAAITDLKTAMGRNFMETARPFLDWLTNVARGAAEARTNLAAMKDVQRAMAEGMDVKNVAAAIEGMKAEREKLLQALAMAGMSGMDDPRAVMAEKKRIQERIEGIDRQMYQLALLANAQQQHRDEVKATVEAEKKAVETAHAAAESYAEWFRASHAERFRVQDIYEDLDAAYITEQLKKIADAQNDLFRVRDVMEAADAWYIYSEALRAANWHIDPKPIEQITSDFEELARGIKYVVKTYDELTAARQKDAEVAAEAAAQQKQAYKDIYSYMGPIFQSFGESAEAMKDAIKDAIASILQMLGKEAFIRALLAFASGNVAGGAGFMAASVAANAAAGAVQAMKEGGIVTKPTAAILGEAGPEAVIPLDKMPQGNITIHVHGNILREREMYRQADRWRRKAYAGY